MSFEKSIKLVTGVTSDEYGEMLSYWIKHVRDCGYSFSVCDLEDRVEQDLSHHYLEGFPPCTYKPSVIEDGLGRGITMWLDVDGIIQDRIDELVKKEFDVCLTLRREEERRRLKDKPKASVLAAGACLFRNTQNTRDFLSQWSSLARQCGNDQQALNQLYSERDSLDAHIETVPTEVYNNYYFDDTEAKILHYKGPKGHKRLMEKVKRWRKS